MSSSGLTEFFDIGGGSGGGEEEGDDVPDEFDISSGSGGNSDDGGVFKSLRDAETFVRGIVARFLVGLVVGITVDFAGLISGAFAWISRAFEDAGDAISDGVGFFGDSLILVVVWITGTIQGAVDASGPFAPVVFAIVVVALGYIVYRLVLAVIEALPVAPGIASLLGLGR